jgi:hypothetical protein
MNFDVSYEQHLSFMKSMALRATNSREAGHAAGAKDNETEAKYSIAG